MIIFYLLSSILCSYGMAVLLVEKRFDFPVRRINLILQLMLRKTLGRKFQNMLLCTICTSFWTSLFIDLCLMFYTDFSYFFWPLSGFATAGIAWTIYETIDVLENKEVGI